MADNKNRSYKALVIILFVVISALMYWNLRMRAKINYYQQNEVADGQQMDSLVSRYDSLLVVVERLESSNQIQGETDLLSRIEINKLQRMGLRDPVNTIKEDLLKNSDLIPYEGSLGGTMDFYSRENIAILNEKWVLAYFEDGHNAGEAILEFSFSNGELKWNVLDIFMK